MVENVVILTEDIMTSVHKLHDDFLAETSGKGATVEQYHRYYMRIRKLAIEQETDIAQILKDANAVWRGEDKVETCLLNVCKNLCRILGKDNPRFDRARFLKACGVQS